MSLDWNATKVTNLDELNSTEEGKSKTINLCWLLMATGIGRVTEANYIEVFNRINIYERVNGALLSSVNEDDELVKHFYTLGDIRDRIGYSTNVSTETSAQWLKRFFTTKVKETTWNETQRLKELQGA
jgi:hypothetical protein